MKTTFTMETEEIREVLQQHLKAKFRKLSPHRVIIGEILVQPKQNYRIKEFEVGEVKIKAVVEI